MRAYKYSLDWFETCFMRMQLRMVMASFLVVPSLRSWSLEIPTISVGRILIVPSYESLISFRPIAEC